MAAIRITNADPGTGVLTLKDSNDNSATNFNAQRGQEITWEIQTPLVSALTGFPEKNVPGNQIVFSAGPSKLGNSQNWQATVNSSLNPAGLFGYSYEITWQDAQGNSHTYDPMIQVNPVVVTDANQ
jgi:hypothetical protein